MAGRNVPKFGNWDSEDNVPYTVYFEKARQKRGGKMINPNNPQENPEMFPSQQAPPPTSKPTLQSEEPIGHGYASSPARNINDNIDRRRRASDSSRPTRQSAGSDRSFEKSPLHKATRKGSASPAPEGKYSYDSSSHGTPGRTYNNSSHGTPGRSHGNSRGGTAGRSYDVGSATPGRRLQKPESPDRGAAVPKFGEWDEKNPQSADNYTYIFNKMRDERHADSTNASGTPTRPPINMNHQDEKFQKRCCPWW